MKKTATGFTIIELLIVIIIVAILATISVVTYGSTQRRARNTQTIQAVAAWTKAVQLHYADTGVWPANTTCLGDVSTYDDGGWCWTSGGYTVNAGTVNSLRPYMGGSVPIPDLTVVNNSTDTIQIRGGRYNASNHSIYYMLSGISTCPSISGLGQTFTEVSSKGIQCGGAVQ